MLLKMLKAAARSLGSNPGGGVAEYPLEVEQKLNRLHASAPTGRHLDVLFQDARVGDEPFVGLFARCLRETGTAVTPFNLFHRYQTRLELVHYLLATLAVPGARVECGVYRGAAALLLCHAWRSRQPDFKGKDFYLIDSFSGTSANAEQDLIPVRADGGATRMEAFFPPGKTDITADQVRGHFRDFPEVSLCAGWIPDAFKMLPEREWAFVHLDLTLYEPTTASLQYFYPRLSKGGIMICDGSIFCPGAEKAWEEFCEQQGIPYVVLGHRELVLIK